MPGASDLARTRGSVILPPCSVRANDLSARFKSVRDQQVTVSSDTYICEVRRQPDLRGRASSTYSEYRFSGSTRRGADGVALSCRTRQSGSQLEGVFEFPPAVAPALDVEHMRRCRSRSRLAVTRLSSPANSSGQSRMLLLVVSIMAPRP